MGSGRAWLHLSHPLPPKQLKHFNQAADIRRKPEAGISCACRAFGDGPPRRLGPWVRITGRGPWRLDRAGRARLGVAHPCRWRSGWRPGWRPGWRSGWRPGSCSAPWCWPRPPLPAAAFKAEETGEAISRENVYLKNATPSQNDTTPMQWAPLCSGRCGCHPVQDFPASLFRHGCFPALRAYSCCFASISYLVFLPMVANPGNGRQS